VEQPAKVAPFAGGIEAAVRKSAAGDFFQCTRTGRLARGDKFVARSIKSRCRIEGIRFPADWVKLLAELNKRL
jgi:hypothetical protein